MAQTKTKEKEAQEPKEGTLASYGAIATVDAAGELAKVKSAAEVQAEIQGTIVLAKHFPRNDNEVYRRIMEACKRSSFAEAAMYSYPRGGATVEGASVHFARLGGREMGNIRWGLNIIRQDEEAVTIEGWGWDVQTNAKVSLQDHFKKLIQRKKEGQMKWIVPDERDLRELINRRGAILVRNCLLQLIPADFIEDGMKMVKKTLKGSLKDRKGTIHKLVMSFSEVGISVKMLELRLEHSLEEISEDELVELRGIFNAIKEGQAQRSEYFSFEQKKTAPPAEKGIKTADVKPEQKAEATEKASPTAIESLLTSFIGYDITDKQIEAHIGHSIDEMTAEDYSSLIGIQAAIEKGDLKVENVFPPLKAEEKEEKDHVFDRK